MNLKKLPWYSWGLLILFSLVFCGVSIPLLPNAVGWDDFDKHTVIYNDMESISPGESLTVSFYVNETWRVDPKDAALQILVYPSEDVQDGTFEVYLNGVDYGSDFTRRNSKFWLLQSNSEGDKLWLCGTNTIKIKNLAGTTKKIKTVTIGEENNRDHEYSTSYCDLSSTTTTTLQSSTTTTQAGSGAVVDTEDLDQETVELVLGGLFFVSLVYPRRVI